jgi:hypothetical protein
VNGVVCDAVVVVPLRTVTLAHGNASIYDEREPVRPDPDGFADREVSLWQRRANLIVVARVLGRELNRRWCTSRQIYPGSEHRISLIDFHTLRNRRFAETTFNRVLSHNSADTSNDSSDRSGASASITSSH